jgi:hypothetical protein
MSGNICKQFCIKLNIFQLFEGADYADSPETRKSPKSDEKGNVPTHMLVFNSSLMPSNTFLCHQCDFTPKY